MNTEQLLKEKKRELKDLIWESRYNESSLKDCRDQRKSLMTILTCLIGPRIQKARWYDHETGVTHILWEEYHSAMKEQSYVVDRMNTLDICIADCKAWIDRYPGLIAEKEIEIQKLKFRIQQDESNRIAFFNRPIPRSEGKYVQLSLL